MRLWLHPRVFVVSPMIILYREPDQICAAPKGFPMCTMIFDVLDMGRGFQGRKLDEYLWQSAPGGWITVRLISYSQTDIQ